MTRYCTCVGPDQRGQVFARDERLLSSADGSTHENTVVESIVKSEVEDDGFGHTV